MSEGQPLVNIPDFSKPATVLIEKIADAVGGLAHPRQIIRLAKAEAEARKIKALSDLEITEIEEKGLARLIFEAGRSQRNIESITIKSLPDLKGDARPEDIDPDWLANFFDKAKIISDEEMQTVWAKLLAGEANEPGTFSKRTIALVSTLEKGEAKLFTKVCSCIWSLENKQQLIIYDITSPVYQSLGIMFTSVSHLESMGLLAYKDPKGYAKQNLPEEIILSYFDTSIKIKFPNSNRNQIDLGVLWLTVSGVELAKISGAEKREEAFDHTLNEWLKRGYIIYSQWPRTV